MRTYVTILFSQELMYSCMNTPLLNDFSLAYAYLRSYDGSIIRSWAGSDISLVDGCACAALGTCPDNTMCRCDSGIK